MSWLEKILSPAKPTEPPAPSFGAPGSRYATETGRILADMHRAVGFGQSVGGGEKLGEVSGTIEQQSPVLPSQENVLVSSETRGKGVAYYEELEKLQQELEEKRRRRSEIYSMQMILEALERDLSRTQGDVAAFEDSLDNAAHQMVSVDSKRRDFDTWKEMLATMIAREGLATYKNRCSDIRRTLEAGIETLEEKLAASQNEWAEYQRRIQWALDNNFDLPAAQQMAADIVSMPEVHKQEKS